MDTTIRYSIFFLMIILLLVNTKPLLAAENQEIIASIKINNGDLTTSSQFVNLNLIVEKFKHEVISMTFTNGGKWSSWEPYKSTRENWNINDERYGGYWINNWRYVYVMFADKERNMSKVYSAKIKYIAQDYDHDGLNDTDEKKFGTDPKNCDTDEDGFLDGEEVLNNFDPLKPFAKVNIDTTNWQVYTNKDYNLNFKSPEYWIKEERGKNEIILNDKSDILPQLEDSIRMDILIKENKDNLNLEAIAGKDYNLNSYPIKKFAVNGIQALQLFLNKKSLVWGDIYVTYLTNKGIIFRMTSTIKSLDNSKRLELITINNKFTEQFDINKVKYNDITPPIGKIIINKGYDITANQFVTLDLQASDNKSSKIYFTLSNGGKWSEWMPLSEAVYNWDLTQGLSNSNKDFFDVYIILVDEQKNISKQYYDRIRYIKNLHINQPLILSQDDENKLMNKFKEQLLEQGVDLGKISKRDLLILFNAYNYGGYPIEAIVKQQKIKGHLIHPTIHWLTWKETAEYKNYINK